MDGVGELAIDFEELVGLYFGGEVHPFVEHRRGQDDAGGLEPVPAVFGCGGEVAHFDERLAGELRLADSPFCQFFRYELVAFGDKRQEVLVVVLVWLFLLAVVSVSLPREYLLLLGIDYARVNLVDPLLSAPYPALHLGQLLLPPPIHTVILHHRKTASHLCHQLGPFFYCFYEIILE